MAFFEWNPAYSVGVSRFDDDHQHLISLLNQLHSAMAGGQGILALNSTLQGLVWYTKSHFKAEEVLMKRYAYPEFASHKAEHDAFAQQVAELVNDFESGRRAIAVEVLDALQDWLKLHILQCDAAYSAYFQANGIADIKLHHEVN
jgi:hemerythrin